MLLLKMLHLVVMVFVAGVCNVWATYCVFHDYELRYEWRLALEYKDEQLNLLRGRQVQNGTLLYMICNDNDIIEVTCENGHFNPAMPLPACSSPLRPQLKQEDNPNICSYRLYLVGFNIKCKNQDYFFDAYKVCFDWQQKRAVFTINEAHPFVIPRPRDMRFDPDEIFTMNIFAAYNKRDIFGRFQQLLGDQQRYMSFNEGDRRLHRGHLTPVADYFMNTLISATFKMINVIPQFHTINDGNWKLMEEWARNSMHTPCKVCSGAFPWVLHLPDSTGRSVHIHLRDNLIPIPLWTYKVVLNCFGVRTVFMQYNNIHDINVPPTPAENVCQVVPCPSSIRFNNINLYGYTYCCEESHFMRSVVPNLQGHC